MKPIEALDECIKTNRCIYCQRQLVWIFNGWDTTKYDCSKNTTISGDEPCTAEDWKACALNPDREVEA